MGLEGSRPTCSAKNLTMKKKLQKLGLNSDNSIVIGSGILQALEIRKSKDIDIVTTQKIYDILKKSGKFTIKQNNGREILTKDLLEIGTKWKVLGKSYKFEDFNNNSIVIDNIRYITLEFLYKAKKSWVREGTVRPKDKIDIKLIEEYKDKL